MTKNVLRLLFLYVVCFLGHRHTVVAQQIATPTNHRPSGFEVVPQQQREQIDQATARGLTWLASQQDRDGSFPTLRTAQPAVTSLCIMAFLTCGHLPGEGKYGAQLERGVDFVLRCQLPNGILSAAGAPGGPDPEGTFATAYNTATYNHAIAGTMLTEVYGMTEGGVARRIRDAIKAALKPSLEKLPQPKRWEADRGGWRYFYRDRDADSDLSITSWYLMFLRSAKNAGFEVPDAAIDEAISYVERCFQPRHGTFTYTIRPKMPPSRAMAGAGIVSLVLSGEFDTKIAQSAADWLLQHPFDRYNARINREDHYHYGAYYCSLAMFQMGGRYWEQFYPRLAKTLVENQAADGSWAAERRRFGHHVFGRTLTTSLSVMALGTPYQLLPVYQR